ncbi:hypothetical protein CCHR01_12359 [Colletotrichum chrysophilum]|uniref:Uncharacterized protein n=1 Tax=Colletotrichum chrysophilum TaxID=1836956 RepID=A0AAD9EHJ4_9PEZI|nr:hypothetical protein CCHR01_12359 [Colletotrichum chrysophilum]
MDPGKRNVIDMTKVPDFEQRQSVPVEGEDQDRLDLPPPYEATASTPASTAAPAVTPPGSSSPAGSVRGEDAAFLPQERGYQRTSPMSVGGSKDEERWEAMRGEPGCCFSDGAGCCFSDRGGCCFSDRSGCCFSDRGGCCFSDTEGCCFSDSKGCCFSSGEAACCSSGPRR